MWEKIFNTSKPKDRQPALGTSQYTGHLRLLVPRIEHWQVGYYLTGQSRSISLQITQGAVIDGSVRHKAPKIGFEEPLTAEETAALSKLNPTQGRLHLEISTEWYKGQSPLGEFPSRDETDDIGRGFWTPSRGNVINLYLREEEIRFLLEKLAVTTGHDNDVSPDSRAVLLSAYNLSDRSEVPEWTRLLKWLRFDLANVWFYESTDQEDEWVLAYAVAGVWI